MNTSTCTSMNSLPADIFDLKHEDFYNFVQYECGPIQSKILKFQLISDVDTFLECNDPTEILKYKSAKLNELKAESCLMTDENSFVIFPGIIASFSSLKKRLMKKIDENIKEIKRNKSSVNASASTPSTAPTTSTQSKTVDELRNHINKSIKQWLDKYRDDLNLQSDCSLTESIDYTIEFKNNFIGQESVVITCTCGSKSSLCRNANDGYYKVSILLHFIE